MTSNMKRNPEQGSLMTRNRKRNALNLEQGWNLLQEGITKLKNLLEGVPEEQFQPDQFMELYTFIYNVCMQRSEPEDCTQAKVYDRYKEYINEYINTVVLPALRQKHDEFLLRELVRRWENHKIMMRWLWRCFHYLDRHFTQREALPTLSKVGFTCFRDQVYTEMKEKVRDVVLTLIDREREGKQIDRYLLKNVLGVFVMMGMKDMDAHQSDFDAYQSDFELAMLADTATYYSRKAALWIQEDSCSDYMLKAEDSLNREKERVGHYLRANSEPKLLEQVQHKVLVQYENQILEKEHFGCHALLRDGKVEDLSRMYRLFCRIPQGLEPVATIFRQHVTDDGTNLVKRAEDARKKDTHDGLQKQEFVMKVIELQDKYLAYVIECFFNHSLFQKALKEAIEVFFCKSIAGSTTAELLATFCDNLLKKGGSEKLSDEKIEDTLGKVMKLLVRISDKDLFAEFYRQKLGHRLLDKNANDDHERSILTKLKQQFGGEFTSKMDHMLMDLTLATETQASFENYLNNNSKANPGVDLTVTVLNTQFWPSYKSSDLALPAEMAKCVEVFKEFYETKTESRKLAWICSVGTCSITGHFDRKPIELIMTTYQAAVLLLFNGAERLSYTDIKGQLNLTDEDIVTLLHSLSCAKHKILNKYPSSTTVSPDDFFEFNSKFTDKMNRVKIPRLPTIVEKKQVVEHVDKDRRYTIEAWIVRIMKSRKMLPYQQLLSECGEQLGKMFKPDVKVIKKQVEDLISREYLERDKGNLNMLRYLA